MADTSYNENQEPAHKRRVRYKGTHPRSYKEKYKEAAAGKVRRHGGEGHQERRDSGG